MKRLLSTVCAAAIAVCATTAMADTKIGVVNMEAVFKGSPQVKKINSSLRDKFASQRNDIVKMGKQLQDDMQNYNKNKAVLSKSKSKAMSDKIAQEESDLRAKQADFQKQLFQAQNTAMTGFMNKVDAAVAKVAGKKGMNVVMPKNAVVYSQNDMDITSDVMKQLG